MTFKQYLMGVLAAASIGISGIASAADVVIGVPNWPSVAKSYDSMIRIRDDLSIRASSLAALRLILTE